MTDEPTTGSWRLLRPLLFQLNPELAHHLSLSLAGHWARLLDQLSAQPGRPAPSALTRHRMGIEFPNPLGLAAGLVDFKVCSVDATYSGLRFTTR